jgi:hypothetical protein
MAEVYRARDACLGRTVALKLLPARFSSEPERLHFPEPVCQTLQPSLPYFTGRVVANRWEMANSVGKSR